jgi:hypothetical protein
MTCCCQSHQGIYAAKSRHGTLNKKNKTKEELKVKELLILDLTKK